MPSMSNSGMRRLPDRTAAGKSAPRNRGAGDDVMFERLPPHAPEAEQCLLGALLLDGVNGIGRCRELFRSEAKIFYDPRHQRIFDAIDRMADAGGSRKLKPLDNPEASG